MTIANIGMQFKLLVNHVEDHAAGPTPSICTLQPDPPPIRTLGPDGPPIRTLMPQPRRFTLPSWRVLRRSTPPRKLGYRQADRRLAACSRRAKRDEGFRGQEAFSGCAPRCADRVKARRQSTREVLTSFEGGARWPWSIASSRRRSRRHDVTGNSPL